MSLVESIVELVKATFEGEGTGHDWYHIDRVRKVALKLAQSEGADMEVVELAALLHDIADHKFHDNDLTAGPAKAKSIILEYGGDQELADRVSTIITETSFKGAGVETPVSSIESAVVQDADRLDAIGAIGIARTFAYGGHRNQPIHDPVLEPTLHGNFEAYAKTRTSTINHFYEKLLLLKDRMNTNSGKGMAEERHAFMESFLEQFHREWEGRR
ncbi:HD domain-containing protein [Cryomorphaceae bacterium 1068]|nr:HD domain-containing protein [Cryomorphaceae bacterium 1068]